MSRVSISEDKVRELMDNESWITADEAVEYGFATKTEKNDDGISNQLSESLEMLPPKQKLHRCNRQS